MAHSLQQDTEDPPHLRWLRSNWVLLEERLDVEEMCGFLYQNNVISRREKEELDMDKPPMRKARELLNMLNRKGAQEIDKFKEGLKERLPSLATELITEEESGREMLRQELQTTATPQGPPAPTQTPQTHQTAGGYSPLEQIQQLAQGSSLTDTAETILGYVFKSDQERQDITHRFENEMARSCLSEAAQDQVRRLLGQKESNCLRGLDETMFTEIAVLGIGEFGKVSRVRKCHSNDIYVMKTIETEGARYKNRIEHMKAEGDILAETDNEWVVELYDIFQDRKNLYFLMEYIPGGDLMSLLIRKKIFSEPLAQFYIAELVLAIESVHKMGFIHRDIKPDNILVDKDGHIKLTDIGLCSRFQWTHSSEYYQPESGYARQDSVDRDDGDQCHCSEAELLKPLEQRHNRCFAHPLVGIPNYVAPEVLLKEEYSACCDWWSVGVILYDLLIGQPPFLADNPKATKTKIINWKTNLKIPEKANLSQAAGDLICSLCCDAGNRLGRARGPQEGGQEIGGAQEVKSHPFFDGIEFQHLRSQKAPYIPPINSHRQFKP